MTTLLAVHPVPGQGPAAYPAPLAASALHSGTRPRLPSLPPSLLPTSLPPLPAPGAGAGLPRGQRGGVTGAVVGVVVGVVAAHLAVGWLLMQIDGVRETVLQVLPLQVSLLAAAPAPPVPPPVVPPRPQPRPTVARATPAKPPPPAPVVAAAPSPQPAAFAVPLQPPPPAVEPPPGPVLAPAAVAVVAAAAPAAPAPAPPAPATPATPATPAPPATGAAPRAIPPGAVEYLQLPEVVYPRLSRRNREAGVVVVRVAIAASGGAPRELAVQRSSGHPRLDEAALAAVRLARFKPYTHNGQPVEAWALVPIEFELEP